MAAAELTILVSTTKGAFLLRADKAGGAWSTRGPFCDGWPINHLASDPKTGAIWAGEVDTWAAKDPDFAAMIGWKDTELPFGDTVSQIWSLHYANGTLYAGTKPATLLASHDGGATWEEINSLTEQGSGDTWNPGAAGLVLHTILSDPANPKKLWVGISAAGVFATEDGGRTWERRNRLSNAQDCGRHDHPAAPKNGETGHCVHNMMRATGAEDLLYQQNHHGVWRSSDGGRSWDDITAGLPSTFGFPIRVHPRDPKTIWTLPLNGDSVGRFPPEAAAAVWRSRDGGENWEALRTGLPQ